MLPPFDGCYDDMNVDYDLLDPIFDEDLTAQQDRFGGELLADPIFQGCLLRPHADVKSAWAVRFFRQIEMVIPEELWL